MKKENRTERRFVEFDQTGLEIERRSRKEDGEEDQIILRGFAALFDVRTELWKGFYEEIEYGFFRNALGEGSGDIFGLFNHNEDFILGERTAGTLRLRELNRGLYYEMDLADTQTNRDRIVSPIERGELKGSSFGFTVKEEGDKVQRSGDDLVRTLLSGGAKRIYDVGPVTYPAYTSTDTEIAQRSLKGFQEEQARRAREELENQKTFLNIQLDIALNEAHL